MRKLRTNEIVAPRAVTQGKQLRNLVREDVVPQLLIVRDEAGANRPDITSYTAALKQQAARIQRAAGYIVSSQVPLEQLVRVETVAAADLRYVVQDANDDPGVDSIMVMSPTEVDYDELVALLAPGKDIDGMNPTSGRMPCTPRAIKAALEHHGLWSDDLRYLLVGKGRTVNSHVDAALQELHGDNYGDRVQIVTKRNEGQLEAAMGLSDVAIVAAGARHQIRADMIRPDMQAVVGVCIEDIHPDAYRLRGDTLITPVHRDPVNMGIGALTASIAMQGTLDAATLRSMG